VPVDRVQIEFVPLRIGLDGWKGVICPGVCGGDFRSGFLLALHGSGHACGEFDVLRRPGFSQERCLAAAEIGERVVAQAAAGLTVPDEIEGTHAVLSRRAAAVSMSPRTRWPSVRKRWSCVCPWQ